MQKSRKNEIWHEIWDSADATDQEEHVYTTDGNRLDEIKTNVAIQQNMAGEPEPEGSGATTSLEGWVEHELDKKAGTWARRWWRLRGHCLRVYESQDAVGTPLHTIVVASCALRAPKSIRKGRRSSAYRRRERRAQDDRRRRLGRGAAAVGESADLAACVALAAS